MTKVSITSSSLSMKPGKTTEFNDTEDTFPLNPEKQNYNRFSRQKRQYEHGVSLPVGGILINLTGENFNAAVLKGFFMELFILQVCRWKTKHACVHLKACESSKVCLHFERPFKALGRNYFSLHLHFNGDDYGLTLSNRRPPDVAMINF